MLRADFRSLGTEGEDILAPIGILQEEIWEESLPACGKEGRSDESGTDTDAQQN